MTGQTGETGQTFKLLFLGNLFRAASATFVMFMIVSKGFIITGVELLQPVTAQMSSTHSPRTADRCIDGDTETAANHDHTNLCHTQEEGLPWLVIDFGTPVTVKRVEIFNRDDCCGDRTKNVDVRVAYELPTSSSQMFSGGSLLGHFAGPGTDGQHIIVSG